MSDDPRSDALELRESLGRMTVKRLRHCHNDVALGSWPDDILLQAADEIERLHAHVEALQDKINSHDCACSYDNADDVCMTHSPTVERLTAALRKIAAIPHTICRGRDIARAALEEK